MNNFNLKSIIESILLVAEKPVNLKEIAVITGLMVSDVQKTLAQLMDEFKDKGMKIIRKGDFFHLVSAPENAEFVAKYLNKELRSDLSKPALETLAIIAYKQPITRIEVEEIRGASSDQILRQLSIRGLICEIGRKETPGRPILYGTTMEFLQYFGLSDHKELPPIEASQKELKLDTND